MTPVERMAEVNDALRVGERVLVAFDGPDAAGKTTPARAVADRLVRPSVWVSVDGWHNRREMRLRRGDDSAEGYYLDSLHYDALIHECLRPFASGGEPTKISRKLAVTTLVAAMLGGTAAAASAGPKKDCPPGQSASVTVVGTELVTTCRVLKQLCTGNARADASGVAQASRQRCRSTSSACTAGRPPGSSSPAVAVRFGARG